MSDKERRRRNQCKFVCKQAWIYMKRSSINSLSLAIAMKISWLKLKSRIRTRFSKIRGTTFGNRQQLLSNLLKYREEDIVLSFSRDYDNPYDRCAIEINCYIKGEGEIATLGYVSKELSASISAAMDAGALVVPMIERVTGGQNGYAFGMNFNYIIVT